MLKGKILTWNVVQCHRESRRSLCPEGTSTFHHGGRGAHSRDNPCTWISQSLHPPSPPQPLGKPGMFMELSVTIPTVAGWSMKMEPAWLALLGCWKTSPAQALVSVRKILVIPLAKDPVIQPKGLIYPCSDRGG